MPEVKRHIFLCANQTKAKCADREVGIAVWEYLKKRLNELNLASEAVLRTQANCLRVCAKGPIAVVYPEGVWYHSVDILMMERIITEHLLKGQIVQENLLNIFK